MSQNRSTAVMNRRHEPHDSLDYFPTPPWATRALCEKLLALGVPIHDQTVLDPACGEGFMARPLGEFFKNVFATDVFDYSETYPEQLAMFDYTLEWAHPQFIKGGMDWIITNPPFRLAEDFIRISLELCRHGVAVLVRTNFLEGIDRHRSLFSVSRPSFVLQFVERVPMAKGRLDPDLSTATSYCWVIFRKSHTNLCELDWIAPCRKRLEKDADYHVSPAVPDPMPLFDGSVA